MLLLTINKWSMSTQEKLL